MSCLADGILCRMLRSTHSQPTTFFENHAKIILVKQCPSYSIAVVA